MKQILLVFISLFLFSAAYTLSAGDVRSILEKPAPTVLDALVLISAMDNPDVTAETVDTNGNPRIAALQKSAPLTVGDFGIIAIERKKAAGGLFYMITGFGKYAAESLAHQRLIPRNYYFSKQVNGKELIELVSALQEKNSQEK